MRTGGSRGTEARCQARPGGWPSIGGRPLSRPKQHFPCLSPGSGSPGSGSLRKGLADSVRVAVESAHAQSQPAPGQLLGFPGHCPVSAGGLASFPSSRPADQTHEEWLSLGLRAELSVSTKFRKPSTRKTRSNPAFRKVTRSTWAQGRAPFRAGACVSSW